MYGPSQATAKPRLADRDERGPRHTGALSNSPSTVDFYAAAGGGGITL
jgi:hypothetical protein